MPDTPQPQPQLSTEDKWQRLKEHYLHNGFGGNPDAPDMYIRCLHPAPFFYDRKKIADIFSLLEMKVMVDNLDETDKLLIRLLAYMMGGFSK